MPTVAQVEDALRTWVKNAAGLGERVIMADQGHARPQRPYADVKVNAMESRGRDEQRPIDDDGEREVVGVRAVRATIRTFGANALELSEKIRSALWLETVTDLLRAAGVSFWTAQPSLDLTTAIETSLEPRAVFEALFGVASMQTENVGIIECVEGEGTFLDVAGTTVATMEYGVCVDDETLLIDGEPVTIDGEPITL